MTLSRLRRALLAVQLPILLAMAHQLPAAGISAGIGTPNAWEAVAGTGTTAYFVYADQENPDKPVNETSNFVRKVNGEFVDVNVPVPAAPGIAINIYPPTGEKSYSPVRGVNGIPKWGAGVTFESMTSVSGDFFGEAGQIGPTGKTPTNSMFATGFKPASRPAASTGAAAAASFDPIEVAPGTYSYPQIVSASFDLENQFESGGGLWFAVDSRFTDPETFYERDTPLDEALWYLSISASGPVDDPADLIVDFHINPLARSLGIFNPSLSDSQIASGVVGALVMDAGVVSLPEVSLFPSDSTFNVLSEDGMISFGVGVNAAYQVVPEPSTFLLAALGGIGLVLVSRRQGHHTHVAGRFSSRATPLRP